MKNIGLLALVSLLSAFLAVSVYKYFEEPQQVIIRESSPAVYTNFTEGALPIVKDEKENTNPKKRERTLSLPTDFVGAAKKVTPAVVNIKAIENRSVSNFWQGGGSSSSSGSGVIISKDGYIVTNNHVIEEGNELEVTLNDKREFKAKKIGVDPSTDLAVLKIEGENLPHIAFGNSDDVNVGEWVLAVGNPFNLESTVTAGIVSAKGRNINILEDQYSIESFIQTDAAVNPGNSGGALVSTAGTLVGINTAIITQSGRYEGYSFAVPSNLVKKVIQDIIDYGIVQRGMLGVGIDPMTDQLAKDLGLSSVEGVYVKRVEQGSGAADSGLEKGDVIISINNVKTNRMPELQEQVARFSPGDAIAIEYIRDGKRYETDVVLKNKSNSVNLITRSVKDTELLEDLGFELRNLTREERKQMRVAGAMVKSVVNGSKIDRTNMDPGFIITKVNDVKVDDLDEVIRELKNAQDKVMLEGVYENYTGEYYYAFARE